MISQVSECESPSNLDDERSFTASGMVGVSLVASIRDHDSETTDSQSSLSGNHEATENKRNTCRSMYVWSGNTREWVIQWQFDLSQAFNRPQAFFQPEVEL